MLTFAKLPGLLWATSYKFTSWSSTWMSCMHPWNEGWRTEWLELFIWFRKPVREKKWESYTLCTACFTKIPLGVFPDHSHPVLLMLVDVQCRRTESFEKAVLIFQEKKEGLNLGKSFSLGSTTSHIFFVTSSFSICHIPPSLCSWRLTAKLAHLTSSSENKT